MVDPLGEAREALERAVDRLPVDHVEDQLTEALRLTLDRNCHFARALMFASGVTLPDGRLEFETVSQWGSR